MILIKSLQNEYSIQYDEQGWHTDNLFKLCHDTQVIKEANTQSEIEGYYDKITKDNRKLKNQMPVIYYSGWGLDKKFDFGFITSYNPEEKSCWMSFLNNNLRTRSKLFFKDHIYANTPLNREIIAKIQAQKDIIKQAESTKNTLEESFQEPITLEYIEANK
ncbi:MAG: hypothetical protein WC479_07460 [Candidatus Izemoplasmatales bacterium]|jgi:hypothetical protein